MIRFIFFNMQEACSCSSLSHCEPHIWYLIQNIPRGHGIFCQQLLLFSQILPFFLQVFTVLPSSQCVCVCVVGEHGPIAGGKSSNLLRWPSSGRVIHPYPFTSPTHSNLFLLLPPKQPPKESVYVTGTRSECRLSAKDAKLCHKPREQRHSAAGQCES